MKLCQLPREVELGPGVGGGQQHVQGAALGLALYILGICEGKKSSHCAAFEKSKYPSSTLRAFISCIFWFSYSFLTATFPGSAIIDIYFTRPIHLRAN